MHQNLTLKAFVQSCRHHSLVKCLHFLFLFCCIFHFGQESFAENFYLVQKDRFLEEADQHHQQFYAQSLSTDRRKIVENHKYELMELQSEIKTNKSYLDENIQLKNYLFSIYNRLIERFNLIKDIKLSQELKIEKTDFTPNLFDNEEIKRYTFE